MTDFATEAAPADEIRRNRPGTKAEVCERAEINRARP